MPQLLTCGGANFESRKSGSGGRLHFGMVAGIKSESVAGLNRNSQLISIPGRSGLDQASSPLSPMA